MSDSATPQERTRLILFLSGGQFLVTMDFAMIGTVLPAIGADLHLAAGTQSAVVSVYALVYASLLICGGRLADLWGERRASSVGLTVFAVATVGVACAPGLFAMLVARAGQGIGAALIAPASFSLMHTAIPAGRERHRAYRIFGSLQGAASIAGPLLAGSLTTFFGWRSAYTTELVLTAILLATVRRLVPPRTCSEVGRLDAAGAVLLPLAVIAFIIAVSGFGSAPLSAQLRLACGGLALAALLALLQVERRCLSPLIPLGLFSQPRVVSGMLGTGLAMASSSALFLLPGTLMQQVLGWTAAAAGLGMLPHSLAGVLAGQSVEGLLGRLGLGRSIGLGFGLLAAGLFLYGGIAEHPTYMGSVLIPMLIAGAGSLLAVMLTMADAAATVRDAEQGVVAALGFTAQQIGIAIGSTVLFSSLAASASGTTSRALGHAFLIAAGVALAGLAVSTGLRQFLTGRGRPLPASESGT